jgi:hypothetical protein
MFLIRKVEEMLQTHPPIRKIIPRAQSRSKSMKFSRQLPSPIIMVRNTIKSSN